MGDWLRCAGTGTWQDGLRVTWSVAEGRRGRRWREVVVDRSGSVLSSLLLELGPDRRFSHLELSTPAGLLTLHPEGDRTLHGNAVTANGLVHVRGVAWDPDAVVLMDQSAVTSAIAGEWGRSKALDRLDVLVIAPDLSLQRERRVPSRAPIDWDGLPILEDARVWPLEDEG